MFYYFIVVVVVYLHDMTANIITRENPYKPKNHANKVLKEVKNL